ncbi:MAG: Morphine 6-dehydrogenase [Promethearchaeota archaeon]|nr:MAG: Morphine 6-dehydrogenase [Candidatus Lokiarchaeota archaeon]
MFDGQTIGMRTIQFNNTKENIPVLGMGTYGIFPGESNEVYEQWKKVLRNGIELGMNHIDTAELYGSGHSEKIIGQIIKEYDREEIFITTKMLPSHKTERQMRKAINQSLDRLSLEYVDLYLIHWLESDSSIKNIMKMFETFVDEGKTRYVGVSNFSISEVKEAIKYLKKYDLVTNQVEINIKNQKELRNLSFYQNNKIMLTAYTPLAKASLKGLPNILQKKLDHLSKKYECSKLQIALAWLINHQDVIAIPRTSNVSHLKENAKAAEILLDDLEIESLNHF